MTKTYENNSKSEAGTVVEETVVDDQGLVEYQSSMYHGPLPHPEVLAGYERVLNGAADRIMKMAEEQSAHRRALEARLVESNIQNERRGMHFAFVITIVFVALSGFLIYYDKTVAGYLTLGTVIIGHAYNYISQKKNDTTQENQEKDQTKKS